MGYYSEESTRDLEFSFYNMLNRMSTQGFLGTLGVVIPEIEVG
jgi:hypothetical protein